jgi:hypothetical protein
MFDKMRKLFLQFSIVGIVVILLFAHGNVMAEEVGTTPEGNVIYRFRCPGSSGMAATLNLNWPNHISNHPEFDIDGGGSSVRNLSARMHRTHGGVRRSGQVLSCNYRWEIEHSSLSGQLDYKYKVKRDIISCRYLEQDTLECILKPGGGGK